MKIQPVVFDTPKSQWGEGPWNEEPDRVDFKHAGFSCLALRSHHGFWCGYVAVPSGHPAYGKPFGDVDVEAHCGLSYSHKCDPPICHVAEPGEPDDVWWLGFDCGRMWDLAPGVEATLRAIMPNWTSHECDVYRTLEFVEREIRSLAEQLESMALSLPGCTPEL